MPAIHKKGALFAIHQDSPPANAPAPVKPRNILGLKKTDGNIFKHRADNNNQPGKATLLDSIRNGGKENLMGALPVKRVLGEKKIDIKVKDDKENFPILSNNQGKAKKPIGLGIKTASISSSVGRANMSSLGEIRHPTPANATAVRSKLLSGGSTVSVASNKRASTSSQSKPKPSVVVLGESVSIKSNSSSPAMEAMEDDVYARPVTRKKISKTALAPLIPSTSTFSTPLHGREDEEMAGFKLPAFPIASGGLFSHNEASTMLTKVDSPVLINKGKENIPPLGHRSLGSAFNLDDATGNGPISHATGFGLGMGLGLGLGFTSVGGAATRQSFAESGVSSSSQPTRSDSSTVHGLGFGFTPIKPSAKHTQLATPCSAGKGHARNMSSASGINHFMPPNQDCAYEKARVTPLKSRTKKRSVGHRRGASSTASFTNHFLPPSSSSTQPESVVTPLKSRRKHIRQKSSLSRGFSFGKSTGLGISTMGLGFEMPMSENTPYPLDDEPLLDAQEVSPWESTSSKRSGSSLGSTTKKFWGLDVNHDHDVREEDEQDEDGILRGSPISRRVVTNDIARRVSQTLGVEVASKENLCDQTVPSWTEVHPGVYQAPPPPQSKEKSKAKGKRSVKSTGMMRM